VKKAMPGSKIWSTTSRPWGKAAHYFFPKCKNGGGCGRRRGRAAKVDERGNALDFAVNEKCAAGAGAFIEAMSRALETDLTEIGPMALESNGKSP
jgi:benzoyl-CoA reductase subunit D